MDMQSDKNGRGGVRGLIALNAALIGVLALVSFQPGATAQPAQTRAPGEYVLIGGEMRGGNASAVWVLDSINQELVAVRWDESRDNLNGIGFRDLDADAHAKGGQR